MTGPTPYVSQTAQPARCADKKCDVLWQNPDGYVVFTVCWICVFLLIAHVIVNARRPGIKLKRSRREWGE